MSDGTPGGTHVFKDLVTGSDGSWIGPLWGTGERAYFAYYRNGVNELWGTDGTPEGTGPLLQKNMDSSTLLIGSTLFAVAADQDEKSTHLWSAGKRLLFQWAEKLYSL